MEPVLEARGVVLDPRSCRREPALAVQEGLALALPGLEPVARESGFGV